MYKLYFADISGYRDAKAFKKGYGKVCQYRKDKIDQCKQEDDKVRSLVAGLLFEEACEEYGVTKLLDNIKEGEQGKPYFDCDDKDFPGGSRVYFNISHSGDQVMVGMADTDIGVDIQEMKPVKADIASRCFTEKEQDLYYRASDEDCQKILYKIWCLKESYVKFTGNGLREGLNTFSVLDHMMDAGIWQEKYAYSVTTSDYKVEQGVANIETVKPKSKEEIASEILAKDEKRSLSAPAPEEKKDDKETLIETMKDEVTPRPKVEVEEVHREEAARKAEVPADVKVVAPPKPVEPPKTVIPDKVTFVNKKKDYVSRACGINKCKRYRALAKYRMI